MIVELRRMKIPFIFLLIGALALQNIDNVGCVQIFGDILENLDKWGEHIRAEFIDELKNLSENTTETDNGLEKNLKEQAAEAIKNLEEIGQRETSNARRIKITKVDTFQAILQAFIGTLEDEVNNQRNNIKRSALQVAKRTLGNLLKRSTSLTRISNDLSTTVLDGVIKGQQRIEGIWSFYINTQLRQVARATSNNQTKIDQADDLLRSILRTYDDDLEKCASSVETSVTEFANKVDESIEVGQQILQALLEVIQNCLNAGNTNDSGEECKYNIEEKLEQLSYIPDEISSLTTDGASLLLTRFESSSCVVQTLVKFELEKIHISLTIKQIIDGTYEESAVETNNDDSVGIASSVYIDDILNEIGSSNEII